MSGPRRPAARRATAALAALAVAAGGLVGCSGDDPDSEPRADRLAGPLPEITLAGFDGAPALDLSEVRGPALVNLWASWCTPCRQEMPLLEEFHQRRPDVRVIGVDHLDPHAGEARDLVEQTGVTYELLTDPDGELSGLAPFPVLRGLPWSGVVDADGQLVEQAFVEFTSVAQVEAFVDDALGDPGAGS